MAKGWAPPKTRRKFGWWFYSFDEGFYSKPSAKKRADTLRAKGLLARVVSGRDYLGRASYLVYWKRSGY